MTTAIAARIVDSSRTLISGIGDNAAYTLVAGDSGKIVIAAAAQDDDDEFRTGNSHSIEYRASGAATFLSLPTSGTAAVPRIDTANTTLSNDTNVSNANRRVSTGPSGGQSFLAAGKEFVTAQSLNYGARCRDDFTEAQFAIDFSLCGSGTAWEFRTRWEDDAGATTNGTCPTVTTAAAGGGTAHTFTETDSSTTSDTLSATKSSSETSTDTSTASDTLSAVKATASTPHTFTKTDSSTAADTLATQKAVTESNTDNSTASDTLTATKASSLSVTDSATSSDVLVATQTSAKAFTETDTATAADTLAATKAVTETKTDTSTASDTLVATQASARTFTETDSSSAADTLTATKSVALSVTDSAAISDTLATQKDSTLSVTDGAASSDTLVADRTATITTTDGSSASDTLSATKSSKFPTVEVVASVSMMAVGSSGQSNVQTLTFTPSANLSQYAGDQLVLVVGGVGSAMSYQLPTIGLADASYDYSISLTDPGFTEYLLWPPESGSGLAGIKPSDFIVAIPSGGSTTNIFQSAISWMGARTITSSEPNSYDFTATFQRDCSSLDASAAGNILGGVLLRISNVVPAFSGSNKNWDLVSSSPLGKALSATASTAGSIGSFGNEWSNPNNLALVFAGSNRLFTDYTGSGSTHGVYFYNGIVANSAFSSTELYDQTLQGTTTTDTDHRSYAGNHVSYYLPKYYPSQGQQTNINVNPVSGTDEPNRKFLVTLLDIPSSLSAIVPHDEATASDTLLAVKSGDQIFTETDSSSSSDTLSVTHATVLPKTDAATASDTLSAVKSGSKVFTETDSASSSDTLVVTKAVYLPKTDAATASDTLLAVRAGAKVFTETDSATSADTLLARKSVTLAITDSSTAADELDAQKSGAKVFTKTDSSTTSDTLSATKSVALTLTDSSSSSDTLAVTKSVTQVSTDSSTASDDLSAIKSGADVFTKIDSSSAADTLSITVDRTLSLTDSAATSDTLTTSKGLILNITDSSSTYDVQLLVRGMRLSVTDSSSSGDSLSTISDRVVLFTDNASISDIVTAVGPTTNNLEVVIPGIATIVPGLLKEVQALAVLDIWNTALNTLGIATVADTVGSSPQQTLLTRVFPLFKKQFLTDHVWNGAKKTVDLVALTTTTTENAVLNRWDYAYQLPDDILRVWRLNGLENRPNHIGGNPNIHTNIWEIEILTVSGTKYRAFLTNQKEARIEYVFDVEDADISLLGSLTQHAMGMALAVYVATNFGKSPNEIGQLDLMAKEAITAAKGVDGQEGTPQILGYTSLLGVRDM